MTKTIPAYGDADEINAAYLALGIKKLTAHRAIRETCLDCMGGSVKNVRECDDVQCALHPFRMGRDSRRVISDAQRAAAATARLHRTPESTLSKQAGLSGVAEGTHVPT